MFIIVCLLPICRHPVAKHRPLPASVFRILQKDNLLVASCSVTSDDASQSIVLGEPLAAGSQLYLDLQQTYMTETAAN